ncbi:Scr1 family TA system antitoxin-like transcriptional regulator [Streptomyces sp. NPDC052396]|uniref:helix-turn-helix domain-containing protein n=1 Tax=Streptomyces sp. NPDC052396 TaxID=3365689 RepID=UPI0037D958A1
MEHFGQEVRLERERLGMSREELGKEACCSYSLVAKIEAGVRVPSPEFAETCDRVYPHAYGRFSRLLSMVHKFTIPQGFRKYLELEGVATLVRRYQPNLMPGLAQTEEYARAIMATGTAKNQDELVATRMARQRILTREDPAQVWFILAEAALTQIFGGREVMRRQLERLLELGGTRPHVVQIIPQRELDRESSPFACPVGLLSFDEGEDVAHLDTYPVSGALVTEPKEVALVRDRFNVMTARALSPRESARFIETVLKERYS